METKSIGRRLVHTLTRIAIGAAAVIGGGVVLPRFCLRHLPDVVVMLLGAAAALAGYCLVVGTTERRWPKLRRLPRGLAHLGMGMAFGASLSAIAVGLLWWAGAYHIDEVAPSAAWGRLLVSALPICVASSVIEETLMRGVLLRQVARNFSRTIALLVSAALFGAIHLANPGATLLVGFGLMVQAGLLLGLAYMVSGRLWLPIGLHFAWNFLQAGVFGGALSGEAVRALVTAHLEGPAWISGGQFGIEGSLITTAVCLVGSLAMLLMARSRGIDFSAPDTQL